MAGLLVEVRQEGPAFATGRTDDEGRASFELAPGAYAVSGFPGHTVDQQRTDCVDRREPSVVLDAIPVLTAGAELDCRVLTSFTTFRGGAIPAQNATLTVQVRYCIAGVSRQDYAELCAEHATVRASVVVRSSYPEREFAGRTDATGGVAFAPDQRGPWAVEVATNHELVDRLVVCEREDYPGVPMASAFVEDDVEITCVVFLVPTAYRLTTVGAEDRAEVDVRYRRCPVAYAGVDHASDCGEPIGNAALGLLVDGRAAGTGYADLDGMVRFEVGSGGVTIDPAPLGEPDDRIVVICVGEGAPSGELAYPLAVEAEDRVGCEVYLIPTA